MPAPPTHPSKRGQMGARLSDLLFLLADRAHTQQELMAHFKVDRKTIKRDLDHLSVRNAIQEERVGRHVYYRLGGAAGFKQPDFTTAELATLLLAQEAIGASGPTAISSPFARHAQSLMDKARLALPAALHPRLDALAAVFGSATEPAKDFAPYADVIDRLTEAAVERRRVRLRYYTMARDETSERLFDPYAVYFDPDGATLKVIGHDHKRRGIRPFSIDHVRDVRETGAHFTRPADFNLRDFLAENCFNGIHEPPVTVRLKASGATARVFAERRFHRSQRELARTPRTAEREETITIEMRVAGGRGLVRFILSWSPEVEVLAPDEVREAVAKAHWQALERHAGD
jgi:predicted DNA-binding transcriptional regulator YafY